MGCECHRATVRPELECVGDDLDTGSLGGLRRQPGNDDFGVHEAYRRDAFLVPGTPLPGDDLAIPSPCIVDQKADDPKFCYHYHAACTHNDHKMGS